MPRSKMGRSPLPMRSPVTSRAARSAVADDLRHPILYLRLEVKSPITLAVGRRVVPRLGPPAPGVEISNRSIGSASGTRGPERVRLYEPAGRQRPSGALLWIHGGGMIMGSPEQDDRVASLLAQELGILVASVDYRLAPEHPFPSGLDDCMASLRWLHDNSVELGVDPVRVAVGGASAGGGLAASVAQRARDEGGLPLSFQLLNYPMLDDRTVLRTDHGGAGEFIWTPRSNRFGWTSYLGTEPSEHHAPPYAAPARTADLSDLPPAWIGVGDLDLFHAEDLDYARRLGDAGVSCELLAERGMYHGADQLMTKAPRMVAYWSSMVGALRRHVA